MRNRVPRDLFPWILGVLLLAAGAFTLGVVTARAPTPPRVARVAASPPQPAPTPAASPPAASPPAARLQAAPQPASSTPAPAERAETQPQAVPALQPDALEPARASSPIWQCEINGQKVFADSPCGAGASVRQVGEVNRMNPTPIYSRSTYAAYQPPDPAYVNQPGEDIQSAPGNTVYVTRPVFLYAVPPRWQRPLHPHHPGPHPSPRHL